jgi:hypothetical protein
MKTFLFLLFYFGFIVGIVGSVYCFYRVVWSSWNNPDEWLFWIKWFLSFGVGAILSRVFSDLLAKLSNADNIPPPPRNPM